MFNFHSPLNSQTVNPLSFRVREKFPSELGYFLTHLTLINPINLTAVRVGEAGEVRRSGEGSGLYIVHLTMQWSRKQRGPFQSKRLLVLAHSFPSPLFSSRNPSSRRLRRQFNRVFNIWEKPMTTYRNFTLYKLALNSGELDIRFINPNPYPASKPQQEQLHMKGLTAASMQSGDY